MSSEDRRVECPRQGLKCSMGGGLVSPVTCSDAHSAPDIRDFVWEEVLAARESEPAEQPKAKPGSGLLADLAKLRGIGRRVYS